MISMYATCGSLDEACRLFDDCDEFDLVPHNSMVIGLAKKGLVDESRRLFDEMPSRNSVTWSAMISGYMRNGKDSEALRLFRRMQCEGIEPNVQTMVSLLGACASLGALEQGEWVCAYIKKKRYEPNSILTTAAIDMYCKCGNLAKARQVFENSSVKGLSTWNAMISGLAIHGQGSEAIRMFSRLESLANLRPDHVSFISILTACSHSGLVNEARYYFKLMSEAYGIEPGIEHYGCLVDVLARAGLIGEAERVIDEMPMRPDVMIWGSLLSASRDAGDMETGRRAAAKIVELDPWDSGGYVTLANRYATGKEFVNAAGARMAMKEKGVRKETGSSVVEVEGGVHEFVAGGTVHSRGVEICGLLSGLSLNMREEMGLDWAFHRFILAFRAE